MANVTIKELGKLPDAGERKLVQVQGQTVCVSRDKKLDRKGNPVYRASLVQKDGTFGKSFRTNGSPTLIVGQALNTMSSSKSQNISESQKKALYSGMGYAACMEGKAIPFKSEENKKKFKEGLSIGKKASTNYPNRKGGKKNG